MNKIVSQKRYTSNHLFLQLGIVTVVAVLTCGLSITTAYGQAQTFTDRFTFEFESGGLPLCGGEQVDFSGTANVVFHTTISPDGEIEHTISHVNYQKATAVSTLGERFAISDLSNQISHTDAVSPDQFITVIHGSLIDKDR